MLPVERDPASFDDHENIRLDLLDQLRAKAKSAGLWAPQSPKEYGGMDLPMVAWAVMYEEAARSLFGPLAFNCMAPDDGNMNWYFQYTPGDWWDYDEIGTHILFDATINGQKRTLITHSARNGFLYTFERANGQTVMAKAYFENITWTAGIDQKTGKPIDAGPDQRKVAAAESIGSREHPERYPGGPLTIGRLKWLPRISRKS